MGRLIDIDVLFDYFGNDAIDETTRSNIEYFVSEKGTVEAIPKDEYESRLKADMVAMLSEIQLEIEKNSYPENVYGDEYGINEIISTDGIYELIQQKIDKYKAESEDTEMITFSERQQKIVDALEAVNSAHWIDNHNGTISCSSCQTWFHKDDRYSYMHYCPNCSAKMKESEDKE